jgi:hypothetical protein
MKIITKDKVGTITSDGGVIHADYPTSNMKNSFPGRKWISDQNYDRLMVPISSSTSALYLGNINADSASYRMLSSPKTVSGLTQADPGVVTATAHGFENGDSVYFREVGGMVEVNNSTYVIANKTANTFELTDSSGNDVDTSSFTAYTSGGKVYKQYQTGSFILREVRNYTEFMQGIVTVHNQSWTDLPYLVGEGFIQIELYATLDKKSTITTWNSGSGDQYGELTDGSSAVALDESVNIGIGSIVLLDEATSSDLRTIARDGTSNNIKLTTATAHGFANGDKVFIDSVQVSGSDIEINNKVFELENVASTTIELKDTSTVFVTTHSSATDLGSIAKVHQITEVVGNGTQEDDVTISPNPASHADITTSATVNKILNGIQCGVLKSGYSITLPNPQTGFSDNRKSYSIREHISNGKMYQRNRNKTRVPAGALLLKSEEYNRLLDFYEEADSNPFACLLFDNLGTSSRDTGFFMFSQMPSVSYDSSKLRKVNFQLTEFI